MADYNVPDKVDGDQWSFSDHNSMKSAINSKQDKANLVQDMSSPSNATYPSTAALANALNLPEDFRFRGVLTGYDDPDTKTEVGFYILPPGNPPASGYYPYPDPAYSHGGELVVYKNGSIINQILWYNADNATHAPRLFRRTNNGTSSFEGWYEFPSLSMCDSMFARKELVGVPTIDAPCSFNAFGATDTKGFITLTNDTNADIIAGPNVEITFQYARSEAKVLLVQAKFGGAITNLQPYQLLADKAFVRINETFPMGASVTFYYSIQ